MGGTFTSLGGLWRPSYSGLVAYAAHVATLLPKGRKGLSAPNQALLPSDVEELTMDTVALGIIKFQDVLVRGDWDASRGASLRSYLLDNAFSNSLGCTTAGTEATGARFPRATRTWTAWPTRRIPGSAIRLVS